MKIKMIILLFVTIIIIGIVLCTSINNLYDEIFADFDELFKAPISNDIKIDEIQSNYPNYEIKLESKNLDIIDNQGRVFMQKDIMNVTLKIILNRGIDFRSNDFIVTISQVDTSIYTRKLEINFINIGQGDAIYIELPNNENLLIDAGDTSGYGENSAEVIDQYLENKEIDDIDYFIITHEHMDHYGHADNILSQYNVNNLYTSHQFSNSLLNEIVSSSINQNIQIFRPFIGEYIIRIPGLFLVVIANYDYPEINESSVMVKLQYLETSILFAGDGGGGSEGTALSSGLNLSADILKVSHHGIEGSSGSAFLAEINPEIGIITSFNRVNTTNFGYADTAIQRLREQGIDLFETGRLNHIIITSEGLNYLMYSIGFDGIVNENPEPYNYGY